MSLELISAGVASVAAITDLRWRRIPNWLTVAAFGGGLALHVWQAGAQGLLVALLGAALGLLLLLPFYALRTIGAGDVKLLAALGSIVGPQALVSVILYTAVVGGAISIVLLARRQHLGRCLRELVVRPTHLTRSGAKAPYGVAIASGVYLSLVLPSVLG